MENKRKTLIMKWQLVFVVFQLNSIMWFLIYLCMIRSLPSFPFLFLLLPRNGFSIGINKLHEFRYPVFFHWLIRIPFFLFLGLAVKSCQTREERIRDDWEEKLNQISCVSWRMWRANGGKSTHLNLFIWRWDRDHCSLCNAGIVAYFLMLELITPFLNNECLSRSCETLTSSFSSKV